MTSGYDKYVGVSIKMFLRKLISILSICGLLSTTLYSQESAYPWMGEGAGDIYTAFKTYSRLQDLINNPQKSNEIGAALKSVQDNWDALSKTHLADEILARSLKLKKMKTIMDGFNKCLTEGEAQRRMSLSIINTIRTLPEDRIDMSEDCMARVVDELSVVSADSFLNAYAPVNYMYLRQDEKDYKALTRERFEAIGLGDLDKVAALNEKIDKIDDEIAEKNKKKEEMKKEIREKLYKKVRAQMVRMHGVFNYLLESDGENKSAQRKIEETLKKTCMGCSDVEREELKKELKTSITNLEKMGVKPVNTQMLRRKFSNDVVSLADEVYEIKERRIYDDEGNQIKRQSPDQDLSHLRINYQFMPKSNEFSSPAKAQEVIRRFNRKRDLEFRAKYGQFAELGIIPNPSYVQPRMLEEKNHLGETVYRVQLRRCEPGQECTNLFQEEPTMGGTLARSVGETFGMKNLDIEKFKKTRLSSIEDAMEQYNDLVEGKNFDSMLDKLILNNPIMTGELLNENPEEYLQIICERAEKVSKDKNFDDKLRSIYLGITTALIIGGFIFAAPIAASPLLGTILFGSWYGLTGVSAYFGVKAYNNTEYAQAACYSGTGDQGQCAMVQQYWDDQKSMLLFGVMVPGSHLLKYADTANKVILGVTTNVQGTFNTAVAIRSRVLTFHSQGEYWIDQAYTNSVENSIQDLLNISDEDLAALSTEDRKELVTIISHVTEKEGESGVRQLVYAIKTIKWIQRNGQNVEKELSGLALLKEARRLKNNLN